MLILFSIRILSSESRNKFLNAELKSLNEYDAIVRKIVGKIQNAERIGNSIEIAEKHYSLEKALKKYLELYELFDF